MRLRSWNFHDRIMRNADGGAGGGGGGGGSQQQQQQQQGVWDFSDLPEGLRGGSNEETYGKVKGEYFGLRNKVAAFAPPKDAAGYTFEASDKLKPYFKGGGDDPMMSVARDAALKLGIPNNLFGPFISSVFEGAIEKGIMPAAYDPQAEIKAIGELVAPGKTGAEAKTAIEAALNEAEAFAPALADSMKLSATGKQLLVSLAQEAGGVELLRALKTGSKEFGIQLGGTQQQQGYSWADYDKDVNDPRYSPFGAKYDKAWRETVDAKMRGLPPR